MKSEKAIKAVTACAAVAGKSIDEFAMDIWVEAFLAFNKEELERALGFMRGCYREARLPTINEVECFAKQKLSAQEEAQRSVDLIAESIVKFGYTNPESAKNYIGELGWQLVQELGGWNNLCAIESFKELEYAKIGWRKTAEILHKRASLGVIDYKPKLTESPSHKEIAPGLSFENGQLRLVKR